VIAVRADTIRLNLQKLKAVRKKIADTADGRFRQKLYYLYERLVIVSPQYSGDFTSNWNIVVDGNMPVYKPWPGKFDLPMRAHTHDNGTTAYAAQPHQAGDPEAVNSAKARGAAQLRGVTMKSRVHFVNATELRVDETGHLMEGPDGVERLRPENVIPTGTSLEVYVKTLAQNIKPKPLPEAE
jgi:hypothetical protein